MFLKKIILSVLVFSFCFSFSQEKKAKYSIATIAFYNVENLFDTIDSVDKIFNSKDKFYHKSVAKSDETKAIKESNPYKKKALIIRDTRDTEYTPEGRNEWNKSKYLNKLKNLARVMSELGQKTTKNPPAIIGLAEIENKQVLDDLIKTEPLSQYNYKYIHYNSLDFRGIDTALLYREDVFEPISNKKYELKLYNKEGYRKYSRDQVLVTGKLFGEKIHVIVNHWPSRYGGEERSRPFRMAAAKLNKKIIDSIIDTNKHAKVITMGDLNDDPINQSLKKNMRSIGRKYLVKKGDMYNPMEQMYFRGIGTLAYRDAWSLFDQILVTPELISKKNKGVRFYKAGVFNAKYLQNKEGKYKGYPFRVMGGKYKGFSDHFPVYIYLVKKLK